MSIIVFFLVFVSTAKTFLDSLLQPLSGPIGGVCGQVTEQKRWYRGPDQTTVCFVAICLCLFLQGSLQSPAYATVYGSPSDVSVSSEALWERKWSWHGRWWQTAQFSRYLRLVSSRKKQKFRVTMRLLEANVSWLWGGRTYAGVIAAHLRTGARSTEVGSRINGPQRFYFLFRGRRIK